MHYIYCRTMCIVHSGRTVSPNELTGILDIVPWTRWPCRICPCPDDFNHREIRLIECNAKCRYLKRLTCRGTLRQVFYLSETPTPPMTPYSPPPLHTIYVYTVYCTYTHRRGRGGEQTREKVRGAIVHKACRKIPT
jgi:hypothetical protein